VQDNDTVNWLPGSAESTQVYRLAGAFQNPDVLPAVVVYERASGITEADRAAAAADAKTFATLDLVAGDVIGPVPSGDGQALEVLVPVNLGADGWNKLPTLVEDMSEKSAPRESGLAMYVTGPAGVNADFAEAFEGIDGTLLYSALAVVIIILLSTYRSPSMWLLPVISAGVALTAAQAVIYLLARHADLTVNGQTQGILTVLVFGAGTVRMRCRIGIAVGLLAMLTLLPALLVITGRWVFWPLRPAYGSADHTATGLWARVGRLIAPRPRAVWVTTTVILGALSFGIFQLNANGLSYEDSFVGTPDSIVGQRVLDRHFDSGTGEPVVVIGKAEGATAVWPRSGTSSPRRPSARKPRSSIDPTATRRARRPLACVARLVGPGSSQRSGRASRTASCLGSIDSIRMVTGPRWTRSVRAARRVTTGSPSSSSSTSWCGSGTHTASRPSTGAAAAE